MLEVHYNNPALHPDYVDSSGITIYYTGELRPYDVGILEIGLEYTDKMAIPPRQPGFHLNGYCISECTRVALPTAGITLVAAQLHTHLTGERIRVRHVRGGAELPEMARDDHFSTHFQEIRLLKRRLQLMPGDALVINCTYNTLERTNVTLGGFGIREEMCVSYIHYFPKTDLEVCKSSIETSFLQAYFKYMKIYHDAPTSDEKGISDNYKSIPWTRHNVLLLDRLYETMPLSMQCNKSSGGQVSRTAQRLKGCHSPAKSRGLHTPCHQDQWPQLRKSTKDISETACATATVGLAHAEPDSHRRSVTAWLPLYVTLVFPTFVTAVEVAAPRWMSVELAAGAQLRVRASYLVRTASSHVIHAEGEGLSG
ncbi:hypothetical protein MRX96_013721 [Rhipicephalus microplus]